MKVLIRNGRVIDPANGLDRICDVWVQDGRIAAVGGGAVGSGPDRVIDADGLWVTPGWIDMHVHLREPGLEYKETIASGAKAALKGGFTTICCMPNTKPVTDRPETVKWILDKAEQAGGARVLPIGSLTEGQSGQSLSQLEEMASAGVCGFSEDGKSVEDPWLMKQAFLKARALHKPVMSHCEDLRLARHGVIHDGAAARRLRLPGISADSEDVMIARDLILAENTGAHAHICHISTKGGVQLLREAKHRGVQASGEVCPHHLVLCDEDIPSDDGLFKMNPPLRSKDDRQALWEGLADGTIDAIATDHAPHAAEEKDKGFTGSAFGIVGLETAAGLCISRIVGKGILTPAGLIEKVTVNPARILGLEAGTLSAGAKADITILNPWKEYTADAGAFLSKGRNTPFNGWKLTGMAVYTIINGRVLYENSH